MKLLRAFPGRLRTAAAVIAVAGSVLTGAVAIAQELTLGSRPQPSVKEVSDLLDRPLAEIFAKFGSPNSVFVQDSESDSPKVLIDYGYFSFSFQNKVVKECAFWLGWPGPVYGATLGDEADAIVKAMGTPRMDVKNTDGSRAMVWETTDSKIQIIIPFTKEGKSEYLSYELK